MAPAQPNPYQRASERFALASKLQAAGMILNWDAQTMMPRGGAFARGEEMAALSEVGAELIGSDAAADELAEAEAMAPALEAPERADLSEMRRKLAHARAAPKSLFAAKARLSQNLQAAWAQARADDDFATFARGFGQLLPVVRDLAQAKAEALGLTPYGALMDEYDPGVGEVMVEAMFADLAAWLPPLIEDIRERQSRWAATIPLPAVPAGAQRALSFRLAEVVGHQVDHFRIDPAPHPFSVPYGPGDVRFTTRYDPNPRFAISATLHEAGHAMYEFNLPRELAFRPAGLARGMSVHESQSLSVERLIGRSREFLSFLSHLMAELFGPDPAWSHANLVKTWRRLDEGFIRVEADEVTYPLHIILRFRLERALLSGDLAVSDIPGAWSDSFQSLLGRVPPDDRAGSLQDIHWAAGLFGYFPNYAVGSVLGAQFFEAARRDDPGIISALAQGDLGPYFAWVRPKVHVRASLVDFATLVQEATGAPLSTAAFKAHLMARYMEEEAP
ncbi:MAG TPA: carboxypeptidase M32 [Caulobacteraceae bacterium]|nr:carboxypeptidase M32 [Caulobacteraceae bacterium]